MEIRLPIGTRYLFIALLGCLFTTSAYLIYIFHPTEIITTMVTTFTPTSDIYKFWKVPPVEIFIKIYMFNVTNSEAFLEGREKLRLNEVGPYSYREIMYNINSTFNDNGTLTYIPKRKLEFSSEHSIGDAKLDRLILPNLPLLGITASLIDSSVLTNLAISSISSYIGAQPFVNITLDEYLMGYDDTLVTLANNFVPNWIDFSRFGIFDRIMALDNSSELVTININRDVPESSLTQTYGIERWAGSPGLSYWGYVDGADHEEDTPNSKCNTVEGTFTGTLFPPNLVKGQSLRLFRRAFCRPIPFKYHSSGYTKDGFEAYTFKQDPGFLLRKENNSDNSCYCRKSNPDDCPPSGIGDLSPCYYGIPVGISLPHFLGADPSVLEKIEGLHPNEENHGLKLLIHPKLGVPLEAHMRAQINLIMPDTKYNSKTKPFNNHIIPLLWADLTAEDVPNEVKFYIRLLYHVLPTIEQVLIYVFAIVGILLISASSIFAVHGLSRHSDYAGVRIRYSTIPLTVLKQKQFKPGSII